MPLRHLCILVLALCLSSCIEIKEEVWLNPDASGRAQLEISAPTLLFNRQQPLHQLIEKAQKADKQSTNIALGPITQTQTGNTTTLQLTATFKDARKLHQFLRSFRDPAHPTQPSLPEQAVGKIEINFDLPHYTFRRQLDYPRLLASQNIPPATLNLLGQSSLTSTLHLPTPAQSTNADKISPSQKTLTWTFPLQQLARKPLSLSYRAPIPIPWSKMILASVSVTLILLFSKHVLRYHSLKSERRSQRSP